MDTLEDFENLSINMDFDDGTSLSPHWNTDLRPTFYNGLHSYITPFVRDRTAAQTLATVNRFGRYHLSCGANCPPNHICYPKGERCILGDERPGKQHCCQLDNTLPPNTNEFLKTVAFMLNYADLNPHTRSYRDPGYFRAFKRLFAPALQIHLQPFTDSFFTDGLHGIPNFKFFPDTEMNPEQILRLVLFGSKLLHRMIVHFADDVSIIRNVNESFRNNPEFYWDCSLSTITPGNNIVPPDFLRIARNLNFTTTNTSHTEQDVFDMIVQKLHDTNDAACNIVVQINFQQAGSADFSAITRACLKSSFKGKILCSIHPQTQVTEGTFGSIGIYVKDNTSMFALVLPRGFTIINTTLTRVLIIESH